MRELNNFVDNVATWLPIRINVIQDNFLTSSLRNILVELDKNFTRQKNSGEFGNFMILCNNFNISPNYTAEFMFGITRSLVW